MFALDPQALDRAAGRIDAVAASLSCLDLAGPFGAVEGALSGSATAAACRWTAAGVDAATTSQSEADQKRGRDLRKAEERAGREARALDKRCRSGRPLPTDACPLQH